MESAVDQVITASAGSATIVISIAMMLMFGFLATILWVGPLLDCSYIFLMVSAISWDSVIAAFLSGFPVNLSQGICTVLVMLLFGRPLLDKLDRIKVKYGMMEDENGL